MKGRVFKLIKKTGEQGAAAPTSVASVLVRDESQESGVGSDQDTQASVKAGQEQPPPMRRTKNGEA